MPPRVFFSSALGCLAVIWPSGVDGEVRCEGEGCVASQLGDDTFVARGEIRIDDVLPGDVLAATLLAFLITLIIGWLMTAIAPAAGWWLSCSCPH